ncbi:Z1 domain-containing protein [Cetobacterium sp.]|uniref:Z1 domain-containing protein n=1 Tax=Cetobacterium sp. TaxID=2071632 RepID=UPI003F315C07
MSNILNKIEYFIGTKLVQIEDIKLSDIENEISNVKIIINNQLAEIVISTEFSNNDYLKLTENDFNKIKNRLEAYYNIDFETGVLLSGNEVERDNKWWSDKEKQNGENYYWERYKSYRSIDLGNIVVKTLDDDTDIMMNNIENPKSENLKTFSRYGMVVGHVQSGKTGNYAGLICKAADAGYKVIVVIAGGLDNLRNQTQKRINEYFIGIENGKELPIKKYAKANKSKQPVTLTTENSDFKKRDAEKTTINFETISSPIVLVIKKNTSTLKNLKDWIETQTKGSKIKEHALLVIDDESDYASVNYNDENDPTKINSNIRDLIGLFEKSSYVAYTATPFANIFIDHTIETEKHGRDLFPKDFIYALNAPTNYMGARKYFIGDEEGESTHIVNINDYKQDLPMVGQKSNFKVEKLPPSLYSAIRLFLLNISIRHLRGDGNKHNSMLVHASRFTQVHQQINTFIESYLKEVKEELVIKGKCKKLDSKSKEINDLKKTYNQFFENFEYTFEEIIRKLTDIIQTVFVRDVHQNQPLKLEFSPLKPSNVIAVGGTSLSRGFTLEGLSVTYFIRNSQFYDTLMQMGRWFGYRTRYEDLCKVFIPLTISENFIRIIKATEDLISSLKDMADRGMTPEQFGLGVQKYPGTKLQITAKKKMRASMTINLNMNLSNCLKEETLLSMNKSERERIFQSFKKLIHSINEKGYKLEVVLNSYLYRNVDKKLVLEFFNDNYFDRVDEYGVMLGFPIKFVIEELINMDSDVVDVVVFSLKDSKSPVQIENLSVSVQERQSTMKNLGKKGDYLSINKSKISSSSPERIILENPNEKLTSKQVRELHMKHPLLMLHVLKLVETEEIDEKKEKGKPFDGLYYSYGISFPGKTTCNERKDITINQVYIDELLKIHQIEIDEEGEEYDD